MFMLHRTLACVYFSFFFLFLADRISYGRAYTTVLRPSVVCLYGMYCG